MEKIKMRVLNRYRGEECEQFKGGAVPEGAVIHVRPERARVLIALGNAAPIVGPSETKPADVAKNTQGGTGGPAVPPASSPAVPASTRKTAKRSPDASETMAGG